MDGKSRRRVVGALAVLLLTVVIPPSAAADGEQLLPDLRQAPVGCPGGYGGDPMNCTELDVCLVTDPAAPNGPCVTAGNATAVRLRFTAAEDNVGAGPLVLYGHRNGPASSTMAVRQAFQLGPRGAIPGSFTEAQRATSTSMYFEPAQMHQHWHLMEFERFQLRTRDGHTVVTDRKNGFCLGDRYRIPDANRFQGSLPSDGSPEGRLSRQLRVSKCGYQNPTATDVVEGISVGAGDHYRHVVDFQWLDITGVPSGEYDIVNTVNPDRTLLEQSYDNNSSSIAISVRWPDGAGAGRAPSVHVLRSCPGRQRCANLDGPVRHKEVRTAISEHEPAPSSGQHAAPQHGMPHG